MRTDAFSRVPIFPKRAERRASGLSTTVSSTAAAAANSSTSSTQAPPRPASAPAGGTISAHRQGVTPSVRFSTCSREETSAQETKSSPRARRPRSFARRNGEALPPSTQRYSTTNAGDADGARDRIARLSQTRDVNPIGVDATGAAAAWPLRARRQASTAANGASASAAADSSPSGPTPRAARSTGAPPFAGRRATGRTGAVSRFPNAGFDAGAPDTRLSFRVVDASGSARRGSRAGAMGRKTLFV